MPEQRLFLSLNKPHRLLKYGYRLVLATVFLLCFIAFMSFNFEYNLPKPDPLNLEINSISDDLAKLHLQPLLKCRDRQLFTETIQYGDYWALKNLVRGRRSFFMGCAESITFTTVGDFKMMKHLINVVQRWKGPISYALFAPGRDFNMTMTAIQYLRNCVPERDFIRDYVTFHIYFPNNHMPLEQVPYTEDEALEWPYDCNVYEPYESIRRQNMYQTEENLEFPLNLGRNIARRAVNTHFIFACDIDLYPSPGFIKQFLTMISNNVSLVPDQKTHRVFAVPVFELDKHAAVPNTKDLLLSMYEMKLATALHETSCSYCQLIEEPDKWIRANNTDKLEVISVSKRYANVPFWEPFFVSDNTEPDYDDRITLEMDSDKRLHNYAMCLLDYEYYVLHPAFLVHAPATQREFDPDSERMNYIIDKALDILPEYWKLYGRNELCEV